VAHAYNPSYSGGRDQKDFVLKPALANSIWDPISKIPNTKNGWQSGSRCRPWIQAPVPPKKKFFFCQFLPDNQIQNSHFNIMTKLLHRNILCRFLAKCLNKYIWEASKQTKARSINYYCFWKLISGPHVCRQVLYHLSLFCFSLFFR
jgi:hypothetical protein